MLEIKRAAIGLNEKELLDLERIIADGNKQDTLRFLKNIIYDKIARSQRHYEVYYARD